MARGSGRRGGARRGRHRARHLRPPLSAAARRPALTDAGRAFVAERHLATLSTLRRDGSLHVVAVGCTVEESASGLLVRVITDGASQKVANLRRDPRASVAQLDGARWCSFSGLATVSDDPARVADAVDRYARRYRQPRQNPTRVVIELAVERAMGSRGMLA